MGIKDMAEKAKEAITGAAGKARGVVGDAAEAVVDKVDDVSGGKVPDAVKKAVDKIDGEDETGADEEGSEDDEAGDEG